MSEVRHATDPVSGQKVEIRNDLTKRLRGLYASGPTMPNGEPEFGWRQFGEGVPIQIEAANEIDRLRSALRDLCRAYVGLLEIGRDRIITLGGECDSIEKMETGDPYLIAAKAALQPVT